MIDNFFLSNTLYNILLIVILSLSPVTLILLIFIPAPYGRFIRKGWGPRIKTKLSWIIMESPAVLLFIVFYFLGENAYNPVSIIFMIIWLTHYIQRTFIYPFLIKTVYKKDTPILIALMAITFNTINAYLNASYITDKDIVYTIDWLFDIRFILGLCLFVTGYIINRYSDAILINLRKNSEDKYYIPYGGLFKYVSCPNYLGEIIQWIGWALATWSSAGLCFAIFSISNLLPRAITHHRWYKGTFHNYPINRKAIIPYIL